MDLSAPELANAQALAGALSLREIERVLAGLERLDIREPACCAKCEAGASAQTKFKAALRVKAPTGTSH